jgi:uncharacterized membrane protein
MPKIVTAALALYSAFLIQTSLPNLPSRIPVHFNAAGQPNGWGRPHTLWVLLAFQVLTACLMLSMSFFGRRFPRTVNLGTLRLSDCTPEQRERVLPLLDRMAGWLSVFTSLFFVDIISEAIRAAGSSNPQFHAGWTAVPFVVCMIGLAFYYVWRINKAVRGVES